MLPVALDRSSKKQYLISRLRIDQVLGRSVFRKWIILWASLRLLVLKLRPDLNKVFNGRYLLVALVTMARTQDVRYHLAIIQAIIEKPNVRIVTIASYITSVRLWPTLMTSPDRWMA